MKSLFRPAIFLMDRVKYPIKFTVVNTLFIIPIIIYSLLLIGNYSEEIDYHKEERLGLKYINKIRPLIEYMPQHRGMTNAYLNGNDSFHDKILDRRKNIDIYLADLIEFDQLHNKQLKTENQLKALQNTWNKLKNSAFNGPPLKSFNDTPN